MRNVIIAIAAMVIAFMMIRGCATALDVPVVYKSVATGELHIQAAGDYTPKATTGDELPAKYSLIWVK